MRAAIEAGPSRHPQGPVRHRPSGRRVGGPHGPAMAVCGVALDRQLDADWNPQHHRACPVCAGRPPAGKHSR